MISLIFCRCCCLATNKALAVGLVLLAVENCTTLKQGVPRLRLSYKDLLRLNSSHQLLNSEDDLAFQSLLVDENRAWLMAGAKNHVFLLHLDNPNEEPQKIFWPAPIEQMEHCRLAGKNPEMECANFIRLLQRFNNSHIFACGTGSYQPMCAFIQLKERAEKPGIPAMQLVTHSIESGRGKCPYSPHEPFTGLLIDGEFYSGASVDFMGSNAAFFRTWLDRSDQNYIRTEQNHDNWLNEPVFIGAFAIPDTYNRDDDKVYFFFRETAVEAGQWEKRRIHARVARVCKNDVGGRYSLINRWSTFLKARLVCSIPGLQGTATHFDQLEDVFLLHTRNLQNPLVYGLFTVSSGIFSGSAVCVYSLAAIRAAFNGPFAHKEGLDYQWVEYKGRIPYPRPGTCPSATYDPLVQSTKDFPDEVISFMRTHHLMWDPVYPLHWKPVLMRVNVPFQIKQLVVDRVETASGHVDVLFLGTDEGKVLKVGIASMRGQDPQEISLEEISISKMPLAILDMQLSLKRQEMFVTTTKGLVQLSLYRCELYGKTCIGCCLGRDPYCTWDGKSCRPLLHTKKRQAQCQDLLKANPIRLCQDPTKGISLAEEKVIFGVQNNSTFLECLPSSPQTTIRWLVQRSNTAILEEVGSTGRFSILEQGLLISQLTQEDAGIYHCQGMEQSFSQTLIHYGLHVIGNQAMEVLISRTSKNTETAASHHSIIPLAETQLPHKSYSRALGAFSSNLDEFCNALQQRRRGRQKDWNRKWQRHHQESKRGRVRRKPGPP
ncbi:semaphorin-3D-like isoform X2 [Heteronotia binoei]|uniref:semaphorin-3D-like isoform X2 n=1 Tax=Heteronotia binoei TaxID=13085 RepID=UPI002931CB15|nr:semaphorin-3D-like isoform X2 [Heteronotia binoei]